MEKLKTACNDVNYISSYSFYCYNRLRLKMRGDLE